MWAFNTILSTGKSRGCIYAPELLTIWKTIQDVPIYMTLSDTWFILLQFFYGNIFRVTCDKP